MYFKSIRSSSKGNCLAVFTDTTRVLFDIGLHSMKKTRAAISEAYGCAENIDAVVISHTHSDHVSYYPLRVLADSSIRVCIHARCLDQLYRKHFTGPGLNDLTISTFEDGPFKIGDLTISPFEVCHNPAFPTFGFSITDGDRKMVIATDLNTCDGLTDNFLDADMIFIESNHDLELLRQYYNPNSMYHMPNPDTARFLEDICERSSKVPKIVILGHISPQRNTPKIAVGEIRAHFKSIRKKMEFELIAAPLAAASKTVTV